MEEAERTSTSSITIILIRNPHLSKVQLGLHITNQTLEPPMSMQELTMNLPKVLVCEESVIIIIIIIIQFDAGIRLKASCILPINTAQVFRIPSLHTKSSGQCSFSYQAPTTWNKLPASNRQVFSVSSFKSSLKTFLFSKTFSSVPLP